MTILSVLSLAQTTYTQTRTPYSIQCPNSSPIQQNSFFFLFYKIFLNGFELNDEILSAAPSVEHSRTVVYVAVQNPKILSSFQLKIFSLSRSPYVRLENSKFTHKHRTHTTRHKTKPNANNFSLLRGTKNRRETKKQQHTDD